MDLIRKAIDFAAKAHLGQVRKGTELPYITHPFNVGMILIQTGCPEGVCAAGFLHDTLEDTPVTREELSDQFGESIARLVESCSEPDKSMSWKARKEHTIHSLK
jgi:(p)ppGpp synthase/HD superfamily hydrolase